MYNIDDIIDEYGQELYMYCYNMLRNRQEAEDATQDIFIKAYHSLNKLDEIKSISAWLHKVAYNHCISIIRRKKLCFFIPLNDKHKSKDSHFNTLYSELELDEQLNEVLGQLSNYDRTILILRILEEKSYDEIAVILGKQPDTIRKQYERVRKKVKNLLNQKGVKINGKISIS